MVKGSLSSLFFASYDEVSPFLLEARGRLLDQGFDSYLGLEMMCIPGIQIGDLNLLTYLREFYQCLEIGVILGIVDWFEVPNFIQKTLDGFSIVPIDFIEALPYLLEGAFRSAVTDIIDIDNCLVRLAFGIACEDVDYRLRVTNVT